MSKFWWKKNENCHTQTCCWQIFIIFNLNFLINFRFFYGELETKELVTKYPRKSIQCCFGFFIYFISFIKSVFWMKFCCFFFLKSIWPTFDCNRSIDWLIDPFVQHVVLTIFNWFAVVKNNSSNHFRIKKTQKDVSYVSL